jgi:hypothetical protein
MFEQQIAKGVALLDEKWPGWHERINLDTLDIGSSCDCVIGQLYPGIEFPGVTYELFPIGELMPRVYKMRECGFATDCHGLSYTERDMRYKDLTDEWVECIAGRRADK